MFCLFYVVTLIRHHATNKAQGTTIIIKCHVRFRLEHMLITGVVADLYKILYKLS